MVVEGGVAEVALAVQEAHRFPFFEAEYIFQVVEGLFGDGEGVSLPGLWEVDVAHALGFGGGGGRDGGDHFLGQAEHLLVGLEDVLPVELVAGLFDAATDDLALFLHVVKEEVEVFVEGGHVVLGEEEPVLTVGDDRGDAAALGGHNGDPCGVGFAQDTAHGLGVPKTRDGIREHGRGQDKHIGCPVVGGICS